MGDVSACGLGCNPSLDEVLNANLDKFVSICQGAVVIDDSLPLETFVSDYLEKNHPSHAVCFFDGSHFLNQYKTWYNVFRDVQPFYAMKCNPHPILMDLMCTLPGMSVDCASVEEIQACLDRGISPDHIIFANPVKAVESIEYMRKHNVWTGTVDSVEEIEKMHAVLGEDAKNCNVVIRLWVDDSHSVIALGSKFGCQVFEVPAIIAKVKECGMNAVGVSFHVGTGNSDDYAYEKAIADAHKVFEIAKEYGFTMTLLDMGGGWSGDLGDEKYENPKLEKVRDVVYDALDKYHFREIPNLRMISEPGRYFNAHTISIACQITNVVKRDDRVVYQINEGVMGVFHDVTLCGMDFIVQPLVEGEGHPSTIIGGSHQPVDIIENDISLPTMKVGDYILFRNIGAYSVSLTAVPLRQFQDHVFFVRKSSLSKQ